MVESGKQWPGSMRARRIITVATFAALLAGCAAEPHKQEAQLAELVAMVAGRYDTAAQTSVENAQGGLQHEALQLSITPVDAMFIGSRVFYVQESVVSDARRVTSQQLMSFQVSHGVTLLVASQLALTEPLRWRDGYRNPDLFRSLLPQDVRSLTGCGIVWHKVVGGFDGATDPALCRAPSRATGETVQVEQKYTLRADGLTRAERRLDASGAVVAEERLLQFRRRAE